MRRITKTTLILSIGLAVLAGAQVTAHCLRRQLLVTVQVRLLLVSTPVLGRKLQQAVEVGFAVRAGTTVEELCGEYLEKWGAE